MRSEYHIASAIVNYVTSHREVTNSPFNIHQIRDEVDTLRIRLVDDMDQSGILRKPYLQFTQDFTVSTKRDDALRCMYADIPLLHTGTDNMPMFAYIGGTNLSNPYRVVIGNQLQYVDHTESFIRSRPTVHYSPGRLTFRDGPDRVRIIAVVVKPRDVAPFNGYDWQKDAYPVSGKMADHIIGKTSESYLRHGYRVPVQPNTQSDLTAGGR